LSPLEGDHVLRLTAEGAQVSPELRPSRERDATSGEMLGTGLPVLDQMLEGGIARGTVTLLSGPTGVGKSTLGMQMLIKACRNGDRALAVPMEEMEDVLRRRCRAINLGADEQIEAGRLKILGIEPLRYTPQELAAAIISEVDANDISHILLDSISGYQQMVKSIESQQAPISHLHSLCQQLQDRGVTVLVPSEVRTLTGDVQVGEIPASYLADNIVLLRYREEAGRLAKTFCVLKKRLGGFDPGLRDFQITDDGIQIGDALHNKQQVLSGQPQVVGEVD
ncbi:MAG: ATPase domain-containing protein, partial [Phycisphaeraceae bacterium]|nr:ATPase domain-containing protein [Phycisphaeraceae bacterium]